MSYVHIIYTAKHVLTTISGFTEYYEENSYHPSSSLKLHQASLG